VKRQPTITAALNGFDEHVVASLRRWHVPGAAVAIVRDDEIVYAQGYGRCEAGTRRPVAASTRFLIASCTKSFTATALGLLVDEEKVGWDKPVREYLPAFQLSDPVVSERMVVRDLLTHRSGLPRHDWMWITSTASRAELCARLRHLPLSRDFRAAYQYNNLMYMVAGLVIEAVSGQSWEEFVTTRLLRPLGMESTCTLAELDLSADDLAVGHQVREEKAVPRPTLTRVTAPQIIGPCGPGGSLVSNVLDVAQWLRFQMNEGKVGRTRVVSEKALKEIHSPQMAIAGVSPDPEFMDSTYALGWILRPYRGYRWVSHSGSLSGFNCTMSFMPAARLGVVFLTNVGGSPASLNVPLNAYDRLLGLEQVPWDERSAREARKAERLAKQAEAKATAARVRSTSPSHALDDYAGTYLHPGYGEVTVKHAGARLELQYNALTFRLKHWHYDEFRMREHPGGADDTRVTFQTDRAGRVGSVSIAFEPEVADIVFARKPM
jgi:CubicO group peptidase (beta-lactamase class C family)